LLKCNATITNAAGSVLKQVLVLAFAVASLQCLRGANAPVCAGCHRDVWETYRQTGMGRSFYRPSPQNTIEDYRINNTYYHRPSDSHFTMVQRGGEYYQRRYQLDSRGNQINVMEKRVDYIMGSGNQARTYLHRTPENTLIELPLGWYSRKGGYWAMNPGYDRPDHEGFRRRISYQCMFCHNAYPRISAGQEQPFAAPVYNAVLPEGIDCQRCHGSGTRHVQLAGTAGAKRQDIRNAIVNPARLSPERQMEACMVCHLQSTSFPLPNAIQRYDRGPFSYQPGEPLADFILNFDHAPDAGREDKFEIASAAYRLRRSECFVKSAGKMVCTTCHNPHNIPRGEAGQKHYTAVCRECHSSAFDRQVAAGRHTGATNCIDCHMPKRRTEDVVHVVVTDHYIQRHKPAGDLLADRPERHETGASAYRGPVVLHYPATLPKTPENELYLAVAQVKQGSNLTNGISQLAAAIAKYSPQRIEFYLDLAEAMEKNGDLTKAVPVYRQAVGRGPKSSFALQKLGTALRRSAQHAEAAEVLRKAVSMAPDDALTWHELGLTYRALGRTSEAIRAIGKALERDPELPEAHNNLGIIFLATGARDGAEPAFREAIRIRPDYADVRGNLANLLSAAGKFAEAREHFEVALRLRPGDAATRYNYAMLLGRMSHYDDAQRELEESLRADPGFADAHELLANLLMAKGQGGEAISHYREALRIRPESARAHLGLGMALAAAGDSGGAVPHLQKAAAASDSNAREQALRILRQMGKAP
jgi:predicted CXXCH cytochrome family protein